MTARERTRVRVLATFRNVRTCDTHVKRVKEELVGLANRSSSDKVRELLYQDPLLYTMEEVNALKATLIGDSRLLADHPTAEGRLGARGR